MRDEMKEALRGIEMLVRQLDTIRVAMLKQEEISAPELDLVCRTVVPLGMTLTIEAIELQEQLDAAPPWVRDGIQIRLDGLLAESERVGNELRGLVEGHSAMLGVPGLSTMPSAEM